MSRRLVGLTLDALADLPATCRDCVFWELDPVAGERAAADVGAARLEKEAWVSDTLLEWGTCGQLVYLDGRAAGFVLYAPPAYVPRSAAFPTSPVAADAVLLTTAQVLPEHRGSGLGRMLVQAVARDVVRRGIRAVEAFAQAEGPAGRRTGGAARGTVGGAVRGAVGGTSGGTACLLPEGFLHAVGFTTVRPHARTPRLRMDVRSAATWKEDVEYALDRLLASMQNPVLAPR